MLLNLYLINNGEIWPMHLTHPYCLGEAAATVQCLKATLSSEASDLQEHSTVE